MLKVLYLPIVVSLYRLSILVIENQPIVLVILTQPSSRKQVGSRRLRSLKKGREVVICKHYISVYYITHFDHCYLWMLSSLFLYNNYCELIMSEAEPGRVGTIVILPGGWIILFLFHHS